MSRNSSCNPLKSVPTVQMLQELAKRTAGSVSDMAVFTATFVRSAVIVTHDAAITYIPPAYDAALLGAQALFSVIEKHGPVVIDSVVSTSATVVDAAATYAPVICQAAGEAAVFVVNVNSTSSVTVLPEGDSVITDVIGEPISRNTEAEDQKFENMLLDKQDPVDSRPESGVDSKDGDQSSEVQSADIPVENPPQENLLPPINDDQGIGLEGEVVVPMEA